MRRLNRQTFAGWNSPFSIEYSSLKRKEKKYQNCKNPIDAYKEWSYKDTFIWTDEQIKKEINRIINKRNKENIEIIKRLAIDINN